MARRTRVTVTGTGQITLPAEICRELGIQEGDQLEILPAGDTIRLRRVPRMAPLTRDSFLFRMLGVAEGSGGSVAREHDRILAEAQRTQEP